MGDDLLQAALPLQTLQPDGVPASLQVHRNELESVFLHPEFGAPRGSSGVVSGVVFVVFTRVLLEMFAELQDGRDDLGMRLDVSL